MILALTVSPALAQGTNSQDTRNNPNSDTVSQTQKTKPAASSATVTSPASKSTSASASSTTAAGSKIQTPTTFTPSEHISDDLSVSFPVDI